MRFLALACDYDGTLAAHGATSPETIAALEALRTSGRKLLLVSGRELPDLQQVFARLDLFDVAVLENGALLYWPQKKQSKLLCEPVNQEFVAALRQRGVTPLSVGEGIVATWTPHEKTVLSVIQQMGLELQVIFNKGAVMVLPSGVNKGTGLRAALEGAGLSAHSCVAVGDAENDHAFFALCECSVAVANALESLKSRADLVTAGARGQGVEELIAGLLEDDLAAKTAGLQRLRIHFGEDARGGPFSLPSFGFNFLVAGPSGSGKSTAVAKFLEELEKCEYQYCIIDPEGDFSGFAGAITIGGAQTIAESEPVIEVLRKGQSAVVNLLGIPFVDRPVFFAGLMPRLQELRATTGRPHWIVIDEAHHLLPTDWAPASASLPLALTNTALITVHPEHVSSEVLKLIDLVLAVGREPARTLSTFAGMVGGAAPGREYPDLAQHRLLAWWHNRPDKSQNDKLRAQNDRGSEPLAVTYMPAEAERRRHLRKYATGDVQEKAFFFRGPQGKLNLRAQNLSIFLQMAEGVDEATWMHHLRKGDYSEWVRRAIKDKDLATEIERVEESNLPAGESLARIKQAIEQRYTGAA